MNDTAKTPSTPTHQDSGERLAAILARIVEYHDLCTDSNTTGSEMSGYLRAIEDARAALAATEGDEQ